MGAAGGNVDARNPGQGGSDMRKLLTATAALAILCSVAVLQPVPQSARAATPAAGTLTAPDNGSVRVEYKGTVPPGTGSLVLCENGVNADVFTVTLKGLSDAFYRTHRALMVAHIEWDPRIGSPSGGGSDVALLVTHKGQQVGSSDGGTSEETVPVDSPKPGIYKIFACAFSVAAPQPYEGTVTLEAGHRQKLP